MSESQVPGDQSGSTKEDGTQQEKDYPQHRYLSPQVLSNRAETGECAWDNYRRKSNQRKSDGVFGRDTVQFVRERRQVTLFTLWARHLLEVRRQVPGQEGSQGKTKE